MDEHTCASLEARFTFASDADACLLRPLTACCILPSVVEQHINCSQLRYFVIRVASTLYLTATDGLNACYYDDVTYHARTNPRTHVVRYWLNIPCMRRCAVQRALQRGNELSSAH